MSHSGPMLTQALRNQLDSIEPSVFPSGAHLYPCSARLTNGTVRESVYFVDPESFRQLFRGSPPGSVPDLSWIQAVEVANIAESPSRLPPRFANRIYLAGEHWVSYSFTLVFSWWCHRRYQVGGFVDFLHYPRGRRPSDVRDVKLNRPHGRATPVPRPYWCVFSRSYGTV